MFDSILTVGIVLAVSMLVLVNWWVFKYPNATGVALILCGLLGFAPCLVLAYCIPLHLQAAALVLSLPCAYYPHRGPALYRVVSTSLTVAIWLFAFTNASRQSHQYDEWQRQTPFESLEHRLPTPVRGGNADGPLWTEVDEESVSGSMERMWSLEEVHSNRVRLFHHAVGFGHARMLRRKAVPEHFEPDPTPPVPQPERYEPNAVSLGDEMPDTARESFGRLHVNGLLDFVNADGFGYVKSRAAVAGFRPHRFSKVPEPVERWTVARLELVGLLLHPTPKVYVSENLPRMEDVKRLPTREPDSFETDGVTAIRAGEDLYTRGDDRDARMVGAIRSVDQCVKCHGGERGDLLGAFSYRLRHDGK